MSDKGSELSRREFLRLSGVGLAGLLTPGFLRESPKTGEIPIVKKERESGQEWELLESKPEKGFIDTTNTPLITIPLRDDFFFS